MKKQTGIFYGWWIVAASIIILAIGGPASVAVANIYQAPIIEEFNITASQFAIVNAIVLGTGIFAAPIMSQKYATGNFKRIYFFAILLYGISYGLYSVAPNIYVFYILSFFVGFGYSATMLLPVGILINRWFLKNRGLATSIAFSGLGIGGAFFSQFVTWSIAQFGWRMTYVFYAAIMLIICLPLIIFVIKDSPESMGLVALGAEDINKESQGEYEQRLNVSLPINQTFTKPFFILLIFGSIAVGLTNNGGLGQFPPFFQQLHGPTAAATLISIYSIVGIAGKLLIGIINDKFGITISIVYGSILLALSYALMTGANNYTIAVIGSTVFGLGNAMGTVTPPLLTSSIFSKENYEKTYGYVTSAVNIGLMSGSLLAATIADITGSYRLSWIVLGVLSIACGISWIASFKNSRKYIH